VGHLVGAHEGADGAARSAQGAVPALFEDLVSKAQEEALLGVDQHGLCPGDLEEVRIEVVHALQEAAPEAPDPLQGTGGPAVGGDRAGRVLPGGDVVPELRGGVGVREATPHPDDRDLLLLVGGRFRGPDRGRACRHRVLQPGHHLVDRGALLQEGEAEGPAGGLLDPVQDLEGLHRGAPQLAEGGVRPKPGGVEPQHLRPDAGDALAERLGGRLGRLAHLGTFGQGPLQRFQDVVEGAPQVALRKQHPADLAAGGAGDGILVHRDHLVDGQSHRLLDPAAGPCDRVQRVLPAARPWHQQEEDLLVGGTGRGGGAGHGDLDARLLAGDGLDVVRVVVAPGEGDQLLLPPTDEKPPPGQEPNVAGAQPLPGKGGRGSLLVPVVPAGHAGSPHLDVADLVLCEGFVLTVHDPDLAPPDGLPHVRKLDPVGVSGRHAFGAAAEVQGAAAEVVEPGRFGGGVDGDAQGGLGQPVGMTDRVEPQAGRPHPLHEGLEHRGAQGLGAHHEHPDRAEVPASGLHRLDATQDVAKRHIGRGEHGGAAVRGRLEPDRRVHQEVGRLDLELGCPHVHRTEMTADQPEIVEVGHPVALHVFGGERDVFGELGQVRQEVAVAQHHPLRLSGAAGGVLEHGECVAPRRREGPPGGPLAERVRQEDRRSFLIGLQARFELGVGALLADHRGV